MREPINLAQAGPGNFKRTRSRFVEALWILVEFLLVTNPLQVSSGVRAWALRLFGARIGAGVILRPRLRVKFPWNLEIGDNCWIGEGVWLHNQGRLTIEENVVVSQEAFITTGSHDVYETMDLVIKPVVIRRGAWITTRCIVLQGVEVGENAVVTPGSVVHRSLDAGWIYGGNPARPIRERWPGGVPEG
ncbi:WcaF family extracellular polysaccharide biosynthesis acetyltransferase [Rubrobacter naiadicus]|uniref:WcaF family extracellular polysaccharide biosynthesis acetyltransferase n=1 Tax=Rubrobacter naiadicus TaxID=1392641 RepID=UPI00235FD165|nr:WcaF family extracellular polysaccharide biosynthesis acetyltransferase [Rubrobacter naiadicus]